MVFPILVFHVKITVLCVVVLDCFCLEILIMLCAQLFKGFNIFRGILIQTSPLSILYVQQEVLG